MKNLIKLKTFATLVFIAVAILAMAVKPQAETGNAQARKFKGVYIFTDADPVQPFEVLGTVSAAGLIGSAEYEPVRDRLLKKALKEYPSTEGIILNLREGKTDQADCIKFVK